MSITELSPREAQLYSLQTKGYTPTEIASTLGLSPKTVSEYLNRIKTKHELSDKPTKPTDRIHEDQVPELVQNASEIFAFTDSQLMVLTGILHGLSNHQIAEMEYHHPFYVRELSRQVKIRLKAKTVWGIVNSLTQLPHQEITETKPQLSTGESLTIETWLQGKTVSDIANDRNKSVKTISTLLRRAVHKLMPDGDTHDLLSEFSDPEKLSANIHAISDEHKLTPKELQIFIYLVNGYSISEIAEMMHYASKTISGICSSLQRKFGTNNSHYVVMQAYKPFVPGIVDFIRSRTAIEVSTEEPTHPTH